MGFTQRQAGGKFTTGEADEFIERLTAAAEVGEVPKATSAEPALKTRKDTALQKVSSERLAAELQSRGWAVIEP